MPFLNIFSKKRIEEKPEPKIIADSREKNSMVISYLRSFDCETEIKTIPVADYLINDIAIERKTISDLKSSIIDKRIFSQLREIKQYPVHFLIIEGNKEELYTPPLHENATRGFLLSLILQYQVPVIFSNNEKDTASYLCLLAKKSPKSEISLRQKIPLTEKEQLQFILEGFPNIGPVTAKSLLEKYKTIKSVINAPKEEITALLGKKADRFLRIIDLVYSSS